MTEIESEAMNELSRASLLKNFHIIKIESVDKSDGPLFLKAIEKSRDELSPHFKWARPEVNWDMQHANKFVEKLAAKNFGQEHFKVMYDCEMIGYVGIFPLKYPKQAEIALWITTGYHNLGVGKFVVDETVKRCFEVRKDVLLQCQHLFNNEWSARLAEKSHFTYVGQFTGHHVQDLYCNNIGSISRWIRINNSVSTTEDPLEDPVFYLRDEKFRKKLI